MEERQTDRLMESMDTLTKAINALTNLIGVPRESFQGISHDASLVNSIYELAVKVKRMPAPITPEKYQEIKNAQKDG